LQKGCLGCGNQEEFYGCSDISIGSNSSDSSSSDNNPSKKELAENSSYNDDEKTCISKKLLQELLDELKKLKSAKRDFASDLEGLDESYARQPKSNYPERSRHRGSYFKRK
jgi:hypothetical protein